MNVDSTCPPSSSATPRARQWLRLPAARLGAVSDSVTRAPRARKQFRRGNAAPRRAGDRHSLPLTENPATRHRSFKVVRLNRAKMIATITNRVMTFGSLHPMSSK